MMFPHFLSLTPAPCFTGLDEFMNVLEKRFSKKQQKTPTGLVAKKVRKFGIPSTLPPPPEAPVWAIKKDYPPGKSYSMPLLLCINLYFCLR